MIIDQLSQRPSGIIPADYEAPAPSGLERFRRLDAIAAEMLFTSVVEATTARPVLVHDEFDGKPFVDIVDEHGTLTGFDPTEAQVKKALAASGDASPHFVDQVIINTKLVNKDRMNQAELEVTGIDERRFGPFRLPWYRRRDAVMKQVSSLVSFGGMDSDKLTELNTTANRGEA